MPLREKRPETTPKRRSHEAGTSFGSGLSVLGSESWQTDLAEFYDCQSFLSSQPANDLASDYIEVLLAIEKKCQAASSGGSAGNLKIEKAIDEAATKMWLCETPGDVTKPDSFPQSDSQEDSQESASTQTGSLCMTVVLVTRMRGVEARAAMDAIAVPEQRMEWDGETWRVYELLECPEAQGETEVVRNVLKLPTGLTDRELLQKRWRRTLPSEHGAIEAMVMRSFEDESICPKKRDFVRAFTYLSGYLLRPLPGDEVEVLMVTQQDVGGSIPSWLQSTLKKLAKQKPKQWVGKLEQYCQQQRRR